jgi:hypothetical protein
MAVMTLYDGSRLNLLPVFLMLLILTRVEAGALALALGWRLRRDRKMPSPVSFLPAIGIALAYLAINLNLYGRLASDSSKAKLGQGVSGYWGTWPTGFLHIWHLWPYFAVTPYILAGILFFGWRGVKVARTTLWGKAILPFLLVLFLFYWLFNLPAYHWYYAPFIFLFSMIAITGVPETRRASVLLTIVLLAQGLTNAYWVRKLSTGEHDYAKAGNWLASRTAPDATVAACEIGEVGWLSHRYMFDILGLTTPKNATLVSRRDPAGWLAEDKPDYILMHKHTWVWEKIALQSPLYEEAPFQSDSIYILCKKSTRPLSEGAPCVKLH